MIFNALLLSFYRLKMYTIIWLILIVCVIFVLLNTRFAKKKWWKPFMGLAVVITLAGILYITVFRRESGTVCIMNLTPLASYKLWLSGQQSEALRSNLMNIILFVPFGLFCYSALPQKWPTCVKIIIGVLSVCLLSVGVERIQFIRQCGEVEADDIINNTIGALLGNICIPLESMIWEKSKKLFHKCIK